MRLIDADALKKAIPEHCRSETECLNHFWYDENIISLIDNAPTVPLPDFKEGYKQAIIDGKTNFSRPQDEWVPISERLPEEDGIYLVTLEYVEDSEIVYETDMAKFVYSEKDDCNNGFHKAYTVIAWQPLPEPFEEGGAE